MVNIGKEFEQSSFPYTPLRAISDATKESARDATLEELSELFQDLLVPTLLPDSYALTYSGVRTDQPRLIYGPPDRDDQPLTVLIIDRFPDARPSAPRGFWRQTTIGESQSLIITGSWKTKIQHDGQTTSGWDTDAMTRIYLRRGGWVYILRSLPGDALSEQTLMDTAQSLSPYGS